MIRLIMTTTVQRIYNFSAGPAVLPVSVLEEAQRDLVALPGVGMSVLEISHRSKTFEDILARTEADLRTLGGIPASHKVLFLQGGASLQFSMVPMNLLTAGAHRRLHRHRRLGAEGGEGSAARRHGEHRGVDRVRELLAHSAAGRAEADAGRGVRALHDQQHALRHRVEERAGGRRRAARRDTSSDMFSRPIDVAKYGLIYAGAQKNLGPSGVTLVIIREDLLARSAKSLPTMLNYAVHAENGSMYNTPPCFGIYLMGLVAKWATGEGGLAAIGAAQRAQGGQAVRRDRSHGLLSRHGRRRTSAR